MFFLTVGGLCSKKLMHMYVLPTKCRNLLPNSFLVSASFLISSSSSGIFLFFWALSLVSPLPVFCSLPLFWPLPLFCPLTLFGPLSLFWTLPLFWSLPHFWPLADLNLIMIGAVVFTIQLPTNANSCSIPTFPFPFLTTFLPNILVLYFLNIT